MIANFFKRLFSRKRVKKLPYTGGKDQELKNK